MDRNLKYRPDFASFAGLLVGFGGVIGGLALEGGNISDITQLTGGIIVMCGTIGAVLLTTPAALCLHAAARARWIFFEPVYSADAVISEILGYSYRARRNGIISLEAELSSIGDPFLRKALALAVDGTDLAELRRIMEADLEMEAYQGRSEAKVFESAGGYAPTIGIIGAVLGLIQVMKNLQEIDKVGHGIATAFVATVYGVGLANLLLLPAANKIRARVDQIAQIRGLMLEGVCSIMQGSHPKMISRKLASYAKGISEKHEGPASPRPTPLAEEAA